MRALSTYTAATLPSLIVLGFFVWFANWIPQTRWETPKVRQIDAAMSPADLAVLGKAIMRERGCLTCHTIEPGAGIKGQGRGPNLDGVAERRAAGVANGPGTLVDYLTESLYAPGAYLVDGYANIMPTSVKAPAKLNREETAAVVAYLQSLGGTPTVTIATLPAAPDATATPARADDDTSPAGEDAKPAMNDPEVLLEAFACLGCHSLTSGEVLVGPPLDAAQLRSAAETHNASVETYLLQSIIDPRAVESEEFPAETMPDDYGERLTAAQLYALMRYLIAREAKQ